MWCYKKMLRIKRADKMTNEWVLKMLRGNRSLWRVVRRQNRMSEHGMKHPGLGDGKCSKDYKLLKMAMIEVSLTDN